MTERALVTGSDWDDLCKQHKVMTLKRFRVSDLVRSIKSTEGVLDNCKAFSEFWSSDPIGTTELLRDQDVRLRNEDRHGLQEGHFEAWLAESSRQSSTT